MQKNSNFKTEDVSAKTAEKVFESIRDFGVAVARDKLEKTTGTVAQTQNTSSSSIPNSSQNSISNSSTSQTKPVVAPQKNVQISGNNKTVPNYQKKCC